jgi:Zn-dependent protease
MDNLIGLLFFFIIIIPSAIIHEYAHAWMADYLGDPTARSLGRLTLNPIPHIDMFGTILMPVFLFLASGGSFLFAYAKPVPYNPYNLRDQKRDPALVGIAGPASNIIIAVVFGVLARVIDIPNFTNLLEVIVYANILLAVFNMVPIPPLDGSKVLYALLPDSAWKFKQTLEQYGFFFLLFFIFFAFDLILPIIKFLFQIIVGHRLFF